MTQYPTCSECGKRVVYTPDPRVLSGRTFTYECRHCGDRAIVAYAADAELPTMQQMEMEI